MSFPFATVRHGRDDVPVLLGTTPNGSLAGLDLVEGRFLALEPGDIGTVFDTDPAAVFFGVQMAWARGAEVPMAAEEEFHGSTFCLPVGTVLKPNPEISRYSGPVERALEAGRPPEMIRRFESVYMTKKESGVYHAGGGQAYVYRVEPIGKVYGPFDGGWFQKIKNEQLYGNIERVPKMVENYWSGKKCKGGHGGGGDCLGATEYLVREARIVETIKAPTDKWPHRKKDLQTCSGKYQGDVPTQLREEAAIPGLPFPQRAALGMKFEPMLTHDPFSIPVTGFDEVRGQLLRHRAEVPSVETIRMTVIFAGLTVGVGIAQAEHGFQCLVDLFKKGEPPIEQVRSCIWSLGYHKIRERLYSDAPRWAPIAQQAIRQGLKDRELREHLFLHTEPPAGISLAKLSFVLALLGHDVVCLDVRILDRMFGHGMASRYSGTWDTRTELSLRRYETVEDAFLRGNAFYRPSDPIGRARAQWLSWESAGKPARVETHAAWLNVVRT